MTQSTTNDEDSPWKEALDLFLRQVLAFFFPAVHEAIDWSKGYVSLDKEFQRIIRNARIGRRLADKLFKVWLTDGQEAWLLIHIEIQGRREKAFPERMFTYSYRIFDHYHKPAVSLAVLTDADPNWKPDHFSYNRLGCEFGIRFPVAKIVDYRGQEASLEQDRNPFAAIVLAQLKAIETRQRPAERQSWKTRLVKGLYDRGLKKQDIQQLFRLIDWMLTLPEELEQGFRQELDRFEEERKMPYVTSVERLAKQEGRQEGLQEGCQKGRHDELLELIAWELENKFGAQGKRLIKHIRQIEELENLRSLYRKMQTASSLDEVRAAIERCKE